ncbi:MAG TPA: KTSC domain-containing protein, partial [Bacteroidales bacterium]|nr:KTSC domain-containing protein [Bacteroidales bacterium]
DEIFEKIGLYKNTKNFQNHIKPLIDFGWLYFTIPNKLTSRDQKYYTTDLGKKLLTIISADSNSGTKRIPVASSTIAAVGYDKEAHILEIEFHHGAIYQYVDVPEKVYEELMSSPSQGAYFMNEIKSKFKFQQK